MKHSPYTDLLDPPIKNTIFTSRLVGLYACKWVLDNVLSDSSFSHDFCLNKCFHACNQVFIFNNFVSVCFLK